MTFCHILPERRGWVNMIIDCLKMYKIYGEDIKSIMNTMENRRVELRAGSLAEVKIQIGIFQGDALSLLLFVIAVMPLNQILRKSPGGYKLHKSQEKNPIILRIKTTSNTFSKNEKELETLIQAVKIHDDDIGMEFAIEKCAVLIMKSGKRQFTEGIELPNQGKIRTLGEKETY